MQTSCVVIEEINQVWTSWRQFCVENRLKEGDRLVFEVDHLQKQPIVDIYINRCYCYVAKSINLV